jgi:hypothetical protein
MLLTLGRGAAALAVAAFFAISPSSVSASPIKVSASGTLLGALPSDLLLDPEMIGSAMHGDWIIDDDLLSFLSPSGPADFNFGFQGAPYFGQMGFQGGIVPFDDLYLRLDNDFMIGGNDFVPDGTYDLIEVGGLMSPFEGFSSESILAILTPEDWFETEFAAGVHVPEALPQGTLAFLIFIIDAEVADPPMYGEIYAAVDPSSITVSEVPLPAAGWMAMAAFGGLFGMRRFRRA